MGLSRYLTQLLLITITLNVFAQKEIGLFPTRNFSPEEYNSLPQIWSVVQDDRNVIYAANREGVLVFDGESWSKIKIGTDQMCRSLSKDNEGVIYVGSENDFGFLSQNNQGIQFYQSIADKFDSIPEDFGDIWKIFTLRNKVVFQSSRYLFTFADDTLYTIEMDSEILNAFYVNDILFIHLAGKGLFKLWENSLQFIEGSEFFANKKIYVLLPYEYNTFFAFTQENGAFLLNYLEDRNKINVIEKHTDIEKFVKTNQIYSGILIDDAKYSIGTFGGIKVIDKEGNYLFSLNKQTGCIDENVKYQYLDKTQDLWIGLSNGLSLVQVNSPFTQLGEHFNIEGTVEWITRYKGNLYVATSVGPYFSGYDVDKGINFQLQQGIKSSETWITQSFNCNGEEILLVEQNEKIYQLNNNKITVVYEGIPWAIYQHPKSKDKFYFGTEQGAFVLTFNIGTWQNKKQLTGIEKRITDIIEFNDNIWLSAETQGIYKMPQNTDLPTVFFSDTFPGLTQGPYLFKNYQNELLIGTAEGIISYSEKQNRFVPQQELNNALGTQPRYIHRMSVDPNNKLWLVTYIEEEEREEVGFFDYDTDSNLFWNPTPFLGDVKGQINAIYHDSDGVTWLGGSEGLFRYDSKVEKNYHQDFNCLIRKVKLGADSTLFFGTYYDAKGNISLIQPEALKPVLDYKNNSLIFDYSAMNINVGHATQYSYFLKGYDRKWSDWTTKTEKEYTNLPEGAYKFNVKAKNVYKHESSPGVYEFEILPPWYRTGWAYILFVLTAVVVVYVIVTQYTKYLRAVIREKTAEIREQKDEIEHKNNEITASIKYAERIQKAVVPTYEKANELLPEHFVLWRPRDIVSGDFWWMTEKNGLVIMVAADCTGHGVPGAFVSMLGVSFLNEIVGKMEDIQANEILNQLRAHVKTTMKQTGKEGESKDGMDLALIVFDFPNHKIQYAGAYNPLFLIREGELLETKATRNPIGIYIKEVPFVNHEIDIQKGDTLYIFSDGFVDQFGGPDGRKFKTKKFKQLLLDIQKKPMHEQEMILDETVDQWRGEFEQVDDIIMVGIRIN